MPDFPPEAFAEIFSAPELPTVIGGQAVYHWATRYSDRAPELAAYGPFMSKDGDIWASRSTVVALRDRSGYLSSDRLSHLESSRGNLGAILEINYGSLN